MTLNDILVIITKIEENFKFEGGSVDFISDFRTKVSELQETHYQEGGQSALSNNTSPTSPGIGINAVGVPGGVTIFTVGGGGPVGPGPMSFGIPRPDPNEALGPQAEAEANKLIDWLKLEGKL